MINSKRAEFIKQYHDEFGIDQTIVTFDLSADTIKRYLRRAEEFIREKEIKKELEAERNREKLNVLVIPDLHLPYTHKDALLFAKTIRDKYNCQKIVFLGDILDNHYVSFHDKDINGIGAEEEYRRAIRELAKWNKEFPKADVCNGNHDILQQRKAFNSGIAKRWIKSIAEIYDLKGWNFADFHSLGDFVFTHGVGQNSLARSKSLGHSVIQGHLHSKFEVRMWQSPHDDKIKYAGYSGCLIDPHQAVFDYGKFGAVNKLGVTVIQDILGENPSPLLIPMHI